MLLALVKTLVKGKEEASEETAAPKKQSDEELMIAYKEGDIAAFEQLVKRHERGLFNFILRSVGRQELAEELLQEVFIRIVKSAKGYQQTAKFTTWAYTIARNLCIDRARKTKNRTEYSLNTTIGSEDGGQTHLDQLVDDGAHSPSVDLERKVFREQLADALAQLPEDQREVFVMREVTGLKFREIADILECPVPTVKSRMRYALEALRGHMAAYKGHSFDEDDRADAEQNA